MNVMKTQIILILFSILFSFSLKAQTNNPIDGEWYTVENRSIVRFQTDTISGLTVGRVIWISPNVPPERADVMRGKEMARNLTYSSKKQKYFGELYIPKTDDFKNAEIIVEKEKLSITVRMGFTTRTVEWKKKTE